MSYGRRCVHSKEPRRRRRPAATPTPHRSHEATHFHVARSEQEIYASLWSIVHLFSAAFLLACILSRCLASLFLSIPSTSSTSLCLSLVLTLCGFQSPRLFIDFTACICCCLVGRCNGFFFGCLLFLWLYAGWLRIHFLSFLQRSRALCLFLFLCHPLSLSASHIISSCIFTGHVTGGVGLDGWGVSSLRSPGSSPISLPPRRLPYTYLTPSTLVYHSLSNSSFDFLALRYLRSYSTHTPPPHLSHYLISVDGGRPSDAAPSPHRPRSYIVPSPAARLCSISSGRGRDARRRLQFSFLL